MRTTVQMNSRGVVTLPARFRKELGLDADDQLVAELVADGILLRPAVTMPVELYSEKRIAEFEAEEQKLDAFWRTKSE